MLSDEEKKEMLEDGLSITRRNDFRYANEKIKSDISFDEYLKFLNDIQKVFPVKEANLKITETKFNKL